MKIVKAPSSSYFVKQLNPGTTFIHNEEIWMVVKASSSNAVRLADGESGLFQEEAVNVVESELHILQ